MLDQMLDQIKNIISDIKTLYLKNFIHWNAIKILSYLSALIIGTSFLIIFIIILAIIMYLDPIKWSELFSLLITSKIDTLSILSIFGANLGYLIIELIILFLGIIFFIFGYSYNIMNLTNNYFNYFDEGTPKKIFSGIYFNFSIIYKFMKLFFINLGLIFSAVLGLILVSIIIFGGISLYFGGIEQLANYLKTVSEDNFFTNTSLGLLLIFIIFFIYGSYRITFSYIILLDKKNYPNITSFGAVKESFKITKGLAFFKFLLIFLAYNIAILPISFLGEYIKNYGDIVIIIYTIIIFLIFQGFGEFLIFSVYKNIFRIKKEIIAIENETTENEIDNETDNQNINDEIDDEIDNETKTISDNGDDNKN